MAQPLWRQFATEEQAAQIEAACETDIFALLELATLEQRMEEREYGRCKRCNRINAWNGVCYHCLGKQIEICTCCGKDYAFCPCSIHRDQVCETHMEGVTQ